MRPHQRIEKEDALGISSGPLRPGHSPLFFDANGNPMPVECAYHGSKAFLLLNGPSLRTTPLTELQGSFVMTVNNGPSIYRSNANVMVDPASRFGISQWLDPTIQKFVPQSHLRSRLFDNRKLADGQRWEWSKSRVCECPNVVYFRRRDSFNPETFSRERTICWGSTGKEGVRSVMLAALRILVALGFKEIYLVGADFHMDANNRYAFAMEPNEASAAGNARSYAKLNEAFKELQPHLVNQGINVWNCTPKSKLTAFPTMSLRAALEAAKEPIGDWRGERLQGMYDDAQKKPATTP